MASSTTVDKIIEKVAETFGFDEEKIGYLKSHEVSRLITALPFLAESQNPERYGMANFAAFLAAAHGAGEFVLPKPTDNENPLERLKVFENIDGGNREIIRKGIHLLAIRMINGYRHDIEKDRNKEKYNPVGAGDMDAETVIRELREIADSIECPEMDEIMTSSQAATLRTWAPSNAG